MFLFYIWNCSNVMSHLFALAKLRVIKKSLKGMVHVLSCEKQDERLQARWVLRPFNRWYFNYSQLGNCECDVTFEQYHISIDLCTSTQAHTHTIHKYNTLYTNTYIHTYIYGYKHILVIHMLFEIDCFIRGFSAQVYDLLEYFNRALHINVWTSFKISYINTFILPENQGVRITEFTLCILKYRFSHTHARTHTRTHCMLHAQHTHTLACTHTTHTRAQHTHAHTQTHTHTHACTHTYSYTQTKIHISCIHTYIFVVYSS